MITELKNDKNRILWVAVTTILSYFIVHGYRFANTMLSGDSLLMVYQNDYAWQIALGRCFQPIWLMLRGTLTAPWLLCMLAAVWIAVAVYFTTKLLNIQSKAGIVLLSLLYVSNIAITCTNATFLPWTDLFALALALVVVGIWCLNQKGWLKTLAGILCIALSLGTYQAYIALGVGLGMLLVLSRLRSEVEGKKILLQIGKMIAGVLCAGGIYYAFWKLCQKVFNIWTSDSYNGLAGMGDYSQTSFISLIGKAYQQVAYHFWHPEVFVTLTFREQSLGIFWIVLLRLIHLVLLVLTVYFLLKCRKRLYLQILLLIAFPLGINVICILSKGMVHSLMIFSYSLLYVLPLFFMEQERTTESQKIQNNKIPRGVAIISLLVICWVNIVFTNQVYLKKNLQEEAAKSLMTRILTTVEMQDDYKPGVTKVWLAGSFEQSPAITAAKGFEDLLPYGMGKSAMFYGGTEEAMLNYVLQANINLVRKEDIIGTEDIELGDDSIDFVDELLEDMPCYPEAGSCRTIGDTLVVKISNLL